VCGISGLYRYGPKPITEEQIALFLVGNEHRGNDSTGMAFQQEDGVVVVLKKDTPAWKFVVSDEYKKFIKENLHDKTITVLLHARGATQGNPRDNKNNHPLYSGLTAVIHNGVIRNDNFLFHDLKLKREADTDSDILRAIIDQWGITPEGIEKLDKVSGSAAGAAISPKFPGKLLLFRSGSPMAIASDENTFVFSSEKNTIHKAMRPWVKRWGIWWQSQRPELSFSYMPDHTAWILSDKGLEGHYQFKTMSGNYFDPIRRTYEDYAKRQDEFDRRITTNGVTVKIDDDISQEPAWCSKCQKEWMIPKGKSPRNYTCNKDHKGCGKVLSYPPEKGSEKKLEAVN